uniref:Uncharacterized protein n=1 Tax=Populus alba TaxID=43335 RepID=A0A4U5PL41_POPAL|nr:hypothetical protein D5086_0000209770 [Populus alba]
MCCSLSWNKRPLPPRDGRVRLPGGVIQITALSATTADGGIRGLPWCPNAPNGLARRHDSFHRPRDPLQAVGRVGAAYPRRGRGALTSRARAKVLAAAARLSACRDVPVAVAGIPARDPLQAVGRVGAAYPRRGRARTLLPALVPTNRQPQRAPRLGPTSRQRWPLPVLASWRPGRRVWCGPPSLGIGRRALPRGRAAFNCRARAKVLALLAIPKLLRDVPAAEAWPPSSELRQMAPRMTVPVAPPRGLSLRDPPRLVACPFEIPRGLLPVLRDPSHPPAACCLSLRDPFASSGAGTISLGCFHLPSWPWLRACAPNCRPAAPITLSPRPWVPCGEAGFLCCVPTSVEFECEAVPLRRAPPRGRGANLAAAPVFQSSGIPPNWPTRDRSCFRMRNAMPARGPPPLRPSRSSRSCSIRTTSSPVSAPRLIGVGDRAGRGVAKECYLVDPASSHMLVSKIKPCMCKYELIQTVKLRMAH